MTDKQDQADADATAEEIRPEDVEPFLPESQDLVLHDTGDDQEIAWVLDRHDVEQILLEVQQRALKVWVYDIPGDRGTRRRELSYKGVRDIVHLMNRTGRVKIGVLPETLRIERFREDIGNGGPEPMCRAIIFARDEVTGQTMPGVATEPVYLKLTDATAKRKRSEGKQIPEDNRIFDPFAETKATNKAVRNALRTFIPEELAQTVIAMFTGESERVARIQTEAEARVEELPPALTDERATEQQAKARALYDEIRELGGGRGKIDLTPAHFNAYLTAAQHSHERLDDFIGYLEQRKTEIAAKYEEAS
jgi:hypothetical protein